LKEPEQSRVEYSNTISPKDEQFTMTELDWDAMQIHGPPCHSYTALLRHITPVVSTSHGRRIQTREGGGGRREEVTR
jgi:hypothetical protein